MVRREDITVKGLEGEKTEKKVNGTTMMRALTGKEGTRIDRRGKQRIRSLKKAARIRLIMSLEYEDTRIAGVWRYEGTGGCEEADNVLGADK